ncbi:hypothetical protein FLONG3_7905 [Fusarium longipes]|uniref:Uncharacterized protein n=1 Tax=Fusarium longipes TaxID=694270 RepID=A0A395SB06_9HYPO|nr:hypothetical protein FLONG3_7905 [Fusarium longipes]
MLAPSRQWLGNTILLWSVVIPKINAFVIHATNSSTIVTRTQAPPMMTTAPGIADPFEINTCSYINSTNSRTLWDDPWCSVYVGTVDLIFWPTTGNHSYPSTFRDSIADYTFTSPSVYMIVETMYGNNPCGPLGPTFSRTIVDFDLTEVSTLVPYTDETATTRRATRQLQLSDLDTHCTRSFNRTELMTQTRPVKGDDTRCNPFLTVPKKFKEKGYPYWLHCGIKDNKFGIFDPPYAIPALDELIPARTTSVEKPESNNPTAVPSATAKPPINPGSIETAVASQHKTDPAPGGSSGDKPTVNPGVPQPTVVDTANGGRPSTHQAGGGGGDVASPIGPGASDRLTASKASLSDSNNAKPTPVGPINTKGGDSVDDKNTEAGSGSIPSKDNKPNPVDPVHTEAADNSADNNSEAGNGLNPSQGSLGGSHDIKPNPIAPINTEVGSDSSDNDVESGRNSDASGVSPHRPNSAAGAPVVPTGTEAIGGSGNNDAEDGNRPAASQVSQGTSGAADFQSHDPQNAQVTGASEDSNSSDQEDAGQDPDAVAATGADQAGIPGPVGTLQSAVDTPNSDGPAMIPGMQSDPATVFNGVVSTVTNQVVSLGTAGLEVVNKDTGETSTYAVPAAGETQSDGSFIPASVAVYNGHTIKQGGPAVTVTNAVVSSPYPASPTENRKTSVNTAGHDESSSTVSAVTDSPAYKVTHGAHCIVLVMLVCGWMYL